MAWQLDPLNPNGISKKQKDTGVTPYFAGGVGKPSLLDSVNGKHGAVNIVAGSNVTVDNTGKDIVIASTDGGGGSSTWGSITGTLSSQTDLSTALGLKAATTYVDTQDALKLSLTGGILTGDLTVQKNSPYTNIVNTLANQFSTSAFKAYSNMSSLGNNGGVQVGAAITDAAITGSQFFIDQLDYQGIWQANLMTIDLATKVANFSGAITSVGVAVPTISSTSTFTNKTIAAGSNTITGLGVATFGGISGTPSSTTYLRGDGTWATPASGGGTWGSITGTLSSQTDLQTALSSLLPLTGGTLTGQLTSRTIEPSANATYKLGATNYFTELRATRQYLNATAYFDGAVSGEIGVLDGANIGIGTTTGTKIGTSTTQKLSFFNATPVVQQAAATDLGTVLSNLGLRASGVAYPITTSATVTFSGAVNTSQINTHSGGIRLTPGSTITSTVTLSTFNAYNERVVAPNATAINITLPTTTNAGHSFRFYRADAQAAVVTILGTINGNAAGYNLSAQYKYVEVVSTTTNNVWEIYSSN